MPGFDRTGPMGAGPMTGGRRGYCNPAAAGTGPAYFSNYGYGRGLGLRRGFGGGLSPGRGKRRLYGRNYGGYPMSGDPVPPPDTPGDLNDLREQAEYLKNSLAAIKEKIKEIEKKSAETS